MREYTRVPDSRSVLLQKVNKDELVNLTRGVYLFPLLLNRSYQGRINRLEFLDWSAAAAVGDVDRRPEFVPPVGYRPTPTQPFIIWFQPVYMAIRNQSQISQTLPDGSLRNPGVG